MMVPRSFTSNPLGQKQLRDYDEKEHFLRNTAAEGLGLRRQSLLSTSSSPPQLTSGTSLSSRSNPVRIPMRPAKPPAPTPQSPAPAVLQDQPVLSSSQPTPAHRESPRQLLSATAIPIRKKPKRRTVQRLPNCDYVADFTRLLLEDVNSTSEGSLSSSLTNPQFDGLFGNIDGLVEGQMIVGSEGTDVGILSARSLSSESMPSLASPDDFSNTDGGGGSPFTLRSLSERRMRQVALSESCPEEHPLMHLEHEETDGEKTPDLMISPRPKKSSQVQEGKINSFKSSLTASLKAIKSAAATVSSYATNPPLIQPEDFLARSFFDIQPSLTDDRRPPPSTEPPSPALRRYLNPHTSAPLDSPAQLHFWVDDRSISPPNNGSKAKLKIKRKYLKSSQTPQPSPLPSIVPLATCIPPQIRTAHASSPPIWLSPDGTPSNKHTAHSQSLFDENTGLRQREPRENRDFLRVFVCEMAMRRNGKLDPDKPGRAALWLPPVKDTTTGQGGRGKENVGRGERWKSWTLEG